MTKTGHSLPRHGGVREKESNLCFSEYGPSGYNGAERLEFESKSERFTQCNAFTEPYKRVL